MINSPREADVIAAVDALAAEGIERVHLRQLADALRTAWQAGFDAATVGRVDVMRDADQLHRAVMAGIRCYRSHHPDAARGLGSWESASLAKRIVGNLKSLASGNGFVQFGSRAQEKQERKLSRESARAVAAVREDSQ